MSGSDGELDRLLKVASHAPARTFDRLPHYTEKAILSHWSLMRRPWKSFWATEFFMPALAASILLLLLVQLWQVFSNTSDNPFALIAYYVIWTP
jgi:hypothetical protein